MLPIRHFKSLFLAQSDGPPVGSISSSSLRLSDNFDDLPSPQAQMLCDGILDSDSGQLSLLQPVPLQKCLLLLRTE